MCPIMKAFFNQTIFLAVGFNEFVAIVGIISE